MKSTIFTAAAVAAAITLLPLQGQAQTVIASDNAGNAIYASGYNGLNGGTGFGAFTVTSTGGSAGTFTASASESEGGNGNPGSIDTNGVSFGTYANGTSSGPGDPSVTITRSFNTALDNGGTFSLDFVTGYNDGADGGGHSGVALTNADGTVGSFFYQSGNTYLYNGAAIVGQNFTTGPLHLVYDITSPTSYTFTSTGAVSFSGTGTFASPITGFEVQQTNSNGGDPAHNAYFNNLSETAPAAVPEASSSIGLGLLMVLGLGGLIVARKRSLKA